MGRRDGELVCDGNCVSVEEGEEVDDGERVAQQRKCA